MSPAGAISFADIVSKSSGIVRLLGAAGSIAG